MNGSHPVSREKENHRNNQKCLGKQQNTQKYPGMLQSSTGLQGYDLRSSWQQNKTALTLLGSLTTLNYLKIIIIAIALCPCAPVKQQSVSFPHIYTITGEKLFQSEQNLHKHLVTLLKNLPLYPKITPLLQTLLFLILALWNDIKLHFSLLFKYSGTWRGEREEPFS